MYVYKSIISLVNYLKKFRLTQIGFVYQALTLQDRKKIQLGATYFPVFVSNISLLHPFYS